MNHPTTKNTSSFENSFNDSSSYDSLNVFEPEPFKSDNDGLSELPNQRVYLIIK